MAEFKANLLPFNFIRRWSYDDLIPSLLYFDKVGIPTCGLQTVSDIENPEKLRGLSDDHEIGLLRASEHRFFWPLRDLIAEGVLVPFHTDALLLDLRKEARRPVDRRILEERIADPQTKVIAEEFIQAATRYYDSGPEVSPFESAEEGPLDKAVAVLDWMMGNMIGNKRDWEHVAMTPDGLVTVLSAFHLFDEVREIDRRHRVEEPRALVRPSTSTSFLPIRLLDTLLRRELVSFSPEGDPAAITELMEIRTRRRAELGEFRVAMMEAAAKLRTNAADAWGASQAIDEYVRLASASFDKVDRSMSDKWRLPKLVLRKGGAIVVAGAAAVGGALLAGPAGAAAGGALGAATAEGLKAVIGALGDSAAKPLDAPVPGVDISLAYLFHAKKALSRAG